MSHKTLRHCALQKLLLESGIIRHYKKLEYVFSINLLGSTTEPAGRGIYSFSLLRWH